ncbi:peptidoglycan DD-metalloendopeptidase family protein [Bacillus sp. FJAT-45037]|uniref:peptidoglycan DD-metalloendopeptidase family protein n=1 Tax=Bacillus sp. FJAT-45037 TaxID=2011007 RepID=UPI000C24B3B6|nr:peptidoglycan DD-metalloendopeptidase family protein [Bacillus sp. FJAT-45037]
MVDIIRRVCIALALATFIGVLFIGTSAAKAEGFEQSLLTLEQSLIWPTVGEVTDEFGTRGGMHFGIDIAASEGTTVVSVEAGVVSKSYQSDTYGEVVFIEHENGLETVYAHLHERSVQVGQAVQMGAIIGTVGNTGRSFGNHLHFEVHRGNWNIEKTDAIDPMYVLSDEPAYMYASMGNESPYGLAWQEGEAVYVMADIRTEVSELVTEKKEEALLAEQWIQIESGDTLWAIGEKYRVTVDHLMKWNDLSSDVIHIGQTLVVRADD